MALDGELVVKVVGDASALQNELSGRAAQSVSRFSTHVESAFDKMGEASQLRTTGMVSDMVKAEQSWLLFDRTFRLGIDREMMTVLNAFPVLTKFLAAMSGSPALLAGMLAVSFGRRAVDELVKSFKEAYEVSGKLAEAWGQVADTAGNAVDQLKLQIDQTIESTDRLLHQTTGATDLDRQLDQIAVNADKASSALKRDIDEINKLANDKSLQSGFMGAFFLNQAKTAPVDKFITQMMRMLEVTRQTNMTAMEEAKASGDLRKVEATQQQNNIDLQNTYNNEIDQTKKALNGLVAEQTMLSHFGPLGHYLWADPTDRIVMLTDFLKALQGQLAQFNAQYKEDTDTQHQKVLQNQQEELQKAQQLQQAQIDAQQSIANAKIAAQESAAKNDYRLYQTTLDQETAALINAENDRYAVEVSTLNREIALAKQSPTSAEKLPGLHARLQTATISHHSKLNDITANSAEQELSQMRSLAEGQIANQEKVAQERITIAKQAYTAEHNQKVISDEQFSALEKESESESYSIQFHALADRLNLAKQMGEKGKIQAQQIMGEIEALALQHEARMDQIQQAADTKRITEQRTIATNRLNYELQDSSYRLQQEQHFDTQRLSYHAVSVTKWRQAETQAINQWYAEQQATYAKLETMTIDLYGRDSTQYAELIRKKELLNREYQQKFIQMQDTISQKHQQTFQQMNGEFQSAFNSWMTNPNRLQHEWVGMMDSMAVATIDNLTMMTIKHLQYEIMRQTSHIATNAAVTESDATTAASQTAIHAQSALKSIFMSAKSAAAKAWNAFAAIPPLAAVMAGATFAGVMALAAFEKGGVVGGPEGTAIPILAHAGERVLSGEQTKNFERMVNNNTTNQSGSSVGTINFAPVFQSGGNTPMDARAGFREFNRQLRLSGLIQ